MCVSFFKWVVNGGKYSRAEKNLIPFNDQVVASIGCDWNLWAASFTVISLEDMSFSVCCPLKPEHFSVVLSGCGTEPLAALYNEVWLIMYFL